MSYTWFKLHHDLPDDIKLRRFTPQEKWAWVTLLCLASRSDGRGFIRADDEDIAEYCEFNTTQDWLYYRDKLIAKGMLEISASGTLHVLHWEERQYKNPSDAPKSVNERVRKHRLKKKLAKQQEQECNGNDPVTTEKPQRNDTDQTKTRSRSEVEVDPPRKTEATTTTTFSDLGIELPSHAVGSTHQRPQPLNQPESGQHFDEQAWVSRYNELVKELKLPWSPEISLYAHKKRDCISQAIAACGGDENLALNRLEQAMRQVRREQDDFWIKPGHTITSLLNPATQVFLTKAASYEAQQQQEAEAPSLKALPFETISQIRARQAQGA